MIREGKKIEPMINKQYTTKANDSLTCVFCVGICRASAMEFASKLSSNAINAPCMPDSSRLLAYSCVGETMKVFKCIHLKPA